MTTDPDILADGLLSTHPASGAPDETQFELRCAGMYVTYGDAKSLSELRDHWLIAISDGLRREMAR